MGIGTALLATTASESWWDQNAGSLFIAVAAMVAAGLAAFVSIWNTKRQLAHDRELRHFDHIRDTIDGALSIVTEAVKTASLLSTQVKRTEPAREAVSALEGAKGTPVEILEDKTDEASESESELRSRERALYSNLVEMNTMTPRLEVRLGKDDPITARFQELYRTVQELYAHFEPAVRANRQQAERQGDEATADAVIHSFRAFRTACYRWFNG